MVLLFQGLHIGGNLLVEENPPGSIRTSIYPLVCLNVFPGNLNLYRWVPIKVYTVATQLRYT
jgi:hypothetical protein